MGFFILHSFSTKANKNTSRAQSKILHCRLQPDFDITQSHQALDLLKVFDFDIFKMPLFFILSVVRAQFLAIEVARNREGYNSTLRLKKTENSEQT